MYGLSFLRGPFKILGFPVKATRRAAFEPTAFIFSVQLVTPFAVSSCRLRYLIDVAHEGV